jgi:hypothetical protein
MTRPRDAACPLPPPPGEGRLHDRMEAAAAFFSLPLAGRAGVGGTRPEATNFDRWYQPSTGDRHDG